MAGGASGIRQDRGPLLEQPPAPVAQRGIDEHRRGRLRFAHDADSGEYVPLAHLFL